MRSSPPALPSSRPRRRRRFGATRICAPSPGWASRPPRRSATRTTRGSSTATSSRPTCCSTSAATSGSPTSAWPTCRATPGVTLSGDLPGTLRYMSPEQATGQRALVDRRTDIYSLGATLYELLTLQPAVTGSDKVEIIRRIAEEEPVPIRRLNPAVPVDLATIVTKAISKDPASRYETALKLADDLDRFLDGRPIAARPVGPLSRSWRWCRRKPVQAGLVAALVLALVGGFAGITWNWREAVPAQKQEAVLTETGAPSGAEQEACLEGLLCSQGQAEASEKKALSRPPRPTRSTTS